MAFLLYVILIFLIISIIFATIKIQLIVEEFKYNKTTQKELFTNKKQTNKQLKFLIKLRICIFSKIPVATIKVNEEKLKELEKRKNFEKIQKILKEQIDKLQAKLIKNLSKTKDAKALLNIITIAKELKLQFKKIDLKINIGLENVIATSMLIPIISTIIAFALRSLEVKPGENQYKIMPKYNLQNDGTQINILLKCIIEVKMIHIINIMYIIKNQRKVKKHVRTSNRRSYDYSYE